MTVKAKDLLIQHEEKIGRLEKAVAALSRKVRELEEGGSERFVEFGDLDIDIDASGAGQDVSGRGGASDSPPDAPAAGVDADEPEVSMTIGGSTEEQRAEYRKFVKAVQDAKDEQRGIVEEGDMRTLAPPTPQQRLLRAQLAGEIGWEHWVLDDKGNGGTPLPEDEAKHYYEVGGPLWLYFYDREFVLQQTMATRQRMVQDAMLTSTELAEELSADILKHIEGNDPSVATDNAMSDWDGR